MNSRLIKYLNLSLLILYPIAWAAPLMRAGLLPLFSLDEISVLTGLQSLWASDIFLALVVTAFALFAPYLKTIGLALVHFRLLSQRLLPALNLLGKLAMADIFLIALYITLTKGIGIGRIEVAWGLYMFTACIVASLFISWWTERSKVSIANQPDYRNNTKTE
ncbi:paraquat-inducible protein A [Sulfitobacter sp. MF3-043]|uniref:paraquat-inducible protein A n=1 Tax=Sulfitobacter sediminivivens TaxID=3252902 RepID=UPI0036D77D73